MSTVNLVIETEKQQIAEKQNIDHSLTDRGEANLKQHAKKTSFKSGYTKYLKIVKKQEKPRKTKKK